MTRDHSPPRSRSRATVRGRWGTIKPFLGEIPRWKLAVLVVASAGSGLLEASLLALVSQIALGLARGRGEADVELGTLPVDVSLGIGALIGVAFGLALLRLLLLMIVAALPSRISADVQAALRKETFDLFIRSTWSVQAAEREGNLQSLLSGEIAKASDAVLRLSNGLAALFNFGTLLLAAIVLSPLTALSILAATIALFFGLRPLTRVARRRTGELKAANRLYLAEIGEVVRLTEEIQVFGRGAHYSRRVADIADAVRRHYFLTQFLSRSVKALYQSVAIAVVVAGLGVLYLLGTGELAELGAVVLILVRALSYSQELQTTYHSFGEVAPYLQEVRDSQAWYRSQAARTSGASLGRVGRLQFDDVSFAYVPGRPVVRNVSFEIEPGETIGIVGPSGAGKSTLVQLLLRLRDPASGRFLIDGRDATDLDRTAWTERVAYLPQDARVFSASVADNIRFFRPLDDDAVMRGAALARIDEDIASWPASYGTAIGQRADAVSGGQRQRLCLARALAGQPDVLILDEPTSALDMHAESLVQETLSALGGRTTILIVAHRLSTLTVCDRIMVLEDGRLEAFARPSDLASDNRFYREAVELSRLP